MPTPLQRPHLRASLSAWSSGVSLDRDLRKLYFSLLLSFSSSSSHLSVLFLLDAGVFWDFSFVFLLMGLMSDRQIKIHLIKLSCLLYMYCYRKVMIDKTIILKYILDKKGILELKSMETIKLKMHEQKTWKINSYQI